MRRFIAVGTCTLLLITTFASPAAAARPEHGTGGFSYDLTFDPGDLCPSFGVHWVEDGSRMQALTFPVQANGDQLVRYAGPQWSTFTNLATHFSMVVGGGLRLDLVLHQNGTADVWVDGSVVVSLEETKRAMRLIAEKARIISEGAGALPLGAALSGKAGDGPIVAIVSGGNIDLKKFCELIEA